MQQMRLSLQAPAKINLGLRIKGRRPDGYHLIETLMQKVSLCDEVELSLCSEGVGLECSGELVPVNKENLVARAAELFLQTTKGRRHRGEAGVHIKLAKRIPVAAGLGGGSSDAAATLRGLNELYGFPCSADELAVLGLQLGADVPFFLIAAGAARATGIGEILNPVASLGHLSILLVNPGFSVSTRWVYQTFALTKGEELSNLIPSQKDAAGVIPLSGPGGTMSMLPTMENDLEAVTIAKFPEVGAIKDILLQNGAARALMSGSGPTVFGLFTDQQQANECYALFKGRFVHTYAVEPV
jgi:4-diphosphocytidyl-2-C-methyl-D-erythritol kinase